MNKEILKKYPKTENFECTGIIPGANGVGLYLEVTATGYSEDLDEKYEAKFAHYVEAIEAMSKADGFKGIALIMKLDKPMMDEEEKTTDES